MSGVSSIRSRTVVLPVADVDTDQIFPARFLTTTGSTGHGGALFADWRFDADGRPRPDFVLNRPEARGCEILVAGPRALNRQTTKLRPGTGCPIVVGTPGMNLKKPN